MLIHISLKTNQYIKIAAIIQFTLLLASIVITAGKLVAATLVFYLLTSAAAIIDLLLYTYMIKVLIFFSERRAIVIAFIIYLGLDVVRYIYSLTLGRLFGSQFGLILGLLTFLITAYLFIVTLLVKSAHISFGFKLFAFSLLILILLKATVSIVLPLLADDFSLHTENPYLFQDIINWLEALLFVMPISVILIARGTNDYISAQIGGSSNSLSEMEETY